MGSDQEWQRFWTVSTPHSMDYVPTRWPESPRTVPRRTAAHRTQSGATRAGAQERTHVLELTASPLVQCEEVLSPTVSQSEAIRAIVLDDKPHFPHGLRSPHPDLAREPGGQRRVRVGVGRDQREELPQPGNEDLVPTPPARVLSLWPTSSLSVRVETPTEVERGLQQNDRPANG